MILEKNNTFSTIQKNTYRRYHGIALIVLCDMCVNFLWIENSSLN